MGRHRLRRRSACRPRLEGLEGRHLLAQFGVPWHHEDHLTVSFVPDGTSVNGAPSVLFRTLDALEPRADWQRAVLEAFQAWAADTSVNFALKSDGGQPLGTPGPDQGDPRFGDVRIAAVPLATEDLAISEAHDPFLSGTWSGDILLNSAALASASPDQLLPILLHEVGHVLGLDHSTDPASVMFAHLNQQDSLAPSDVAAAQALYGPRDDDPFEGPGRDDTFATAAPMPEPAGYDGTTPLLIYANLSSLQDADFYTVTAPAGYEGPLTVRLQTAGVSLLAPRLTVYDTAGNVLGDLSSATDTGDTLQVRLPRVEPGATYVVAVRGAAADRFGVGEYVLAASFDARSTVGPDAIDTLARQSYSYLSPEDIRAIFVDPVHALFHVDAHTNDTLATAEDLNPAGVYGSEAPDRLTASLSDPTDVDYYHFETPEEPPGAPAAPLVMTVTVRATEVNGIMPTASVFDARGNLLPALVLAHGDGTYTIQVTDDQPDSDYYVRVSSDPTSGKVVGNYDLDVEYSHVAAAPTTFLADALGGPAPQDSYTLMVNQAQLFDFLLAAPGAPPGAAVQMTLTDARGAVVATRSAPAGVTAGGDPVLLAPGVYQVLFTVESPGGGPPLPVAFRLYGASLTEPIGPALDDPTLRPVADPAAGGPSAASVPVLGSAGAPYYWLAVGLGGRTAASPGEAEDATGALARAGGGPARGPGAPVLVTLGSQAGPPVRTEAAPGASAAPTAPGGPVSPIHLVAAPVLTPSSLITSLTLLIFPPRDDPAGPKAEPPEVPGGAAGPETFPAAPEVRPAARGEAEAPPLVLDAPPPGPGPPTQRPGAPASSPARGEGAEVGADLARTVALLGIAAQLYGQTLARRGGRRDARPGWLPSVMRPGLSRLRAYCRP